MTNDNGLRTTDNGQSLRLRRGAVAALAVYWIALFVGTHIPIPKGMGIEQGDKLLHFLAYMGLAALATLAVGWRTSAGSRAWRLLLLAVGLLAFGAFDELTQPLVNRYADRYDWYADAAGVVMGTAMGAVALRWLDRWRLNANGEEGMRNGE